MGEEFLEKIVEDSLQRKYYKFQHTLSNTKRVDCFLKLGSPHESIAIDSKFSWENYKKMLSLFMESNIINSENQIYRIDQHEPVYDANGNPKESFFR